MHIRLLITLSLMALTLARAENWPQWRGPAFNGSSPERNLPAEWSTNQNVAWGLALPGPSAATPIIWDDRVFLSSTDTGSQALVALCVDRKTGKLLWRQKVGEGIRRDRQSTFSASSPATDGQRVFFFFSTGDLAAFDMAGQQLWARNIQKDYGTFAFLWTFSTSPLLSGGKLYLQVLQRDVPVDGRGRSDGPNDSYLLALDPETGKTLWQQIRPSRAVAESREAFTTPVPFTFNGRSELLVLGGDCLTGHDPATGKELWRWETWNPGRVGHWRLVPSPLTGEGLILACAPKGAPVYAIKAGGTGKLGEESLAWRTDQDRAVTSDVPTPLFFEGNFYILSDLSKRLSCLDPRTGRVKWSLATPGQAKYEASPTGADGKIYLINFRGEVTVVDAAKGQVLRTIPMGEPGDNMVRSSVAVAQGQLFIRTNNRLYCIGRP
jgi:outer membrane protein assembly factor BamB